MGESASSWHVIYSAVPGWTKIPLRAWYKEFEWYYPKCEMQVKEWFVCNVKPDWVMFDVGANVGVYSLLFSQLAPRGTVHAFEPTSTYEMLLRNLDYGKAGNVIPHRMALGKEAGDIEERVFRMWGQEAEQGIYHFTTIDTFVREHSIERLDCIKIDVDSFDFEVMQGAVETLERFDPFVMMEISPDALEKRQVTPEKVFIWLREHGYESFPCFDEENYLLRRKDNPLLQLRKVEVPDLSTHMRAIVPEVTWADSCVLAIPPAYDDLQDAPVLRYFFRHFSPARHLEFGTWKGKGVQRVIEECSARVWTINLWEGENQPDGYWAYSEPGAGDGHAVRTDAKGMIGRAYLEAGLGTRVNQIYSNSLLWEDDVYPNGFFDSVFVDGGHDAATSRADVYKALRLLRPGGLLLLHDFCPLPEVNARYSSTKGVTAMAAAELGALTKMCDALFWVTGTWILCGIRRRDCDEDQREWEAGVFHEARERGRRLAMELTRSPAKMKQRTIWQCAAAEMSNTWEINSVNEAANVFFSNDHECLFQYTDFADHVATFYVDVPPAENEDSPSVFSITLRFPEGENIFYQWKIQIQNKDYNRVAEFCIKSENCIKSEKKSGKSFNFTFDNPGQDSSIRLVFVPVGEFEKWHAYRYPFTLSG